MAKKIYSLLLNDDVVEQIDNLAIKQGISRSNMVNRILGEYFSCDTPEQRMQDIFNCVQQLIDPHSSMRFSNMPSASMACVLSALPCRYKPTVRYNVELIDDDKYIGRLRVSLRSQNSQLLYNIENFYTLFQQLELYNVGKRSSNVDNGRFVRLLEKPGDMNYTEVAEAITNYINMLDELLSAFFAGNCSDGCIDDIKRIYANYLKNNVHV